MSTPSTAEGASRPRARRRWAALAVVVASVIVGGGALLRSRERPRPASPVAAAGAASGPVGELRCGEEMVSLPAGSFRMGSAEGEGSDDERPAHEVSLSAYCLDRREVTVAAYRACVEQPRGALRCKPAGTSAYCNGGRRDRDDHPINCVDWNDAEAYCAWAGKRLPTEAEWESAARRGEEERLYPWGKDAPSAQLCWDGPGSDAGEGRREGTCSGGRFAAKEGSGRGGIDDLAGNVAEWVADAFAPYRDEAAHDPRVADRALQLGKRVVRGGSWFSEEPGQVRAAKRDWFVVSDRVFDVGFRCAR